MALIGDPIGRAQFQFMAGLDGPRRRPPRILPERERGGQAKFAAVYDAETVALASDDNPSLARRAEDLATERRIAQATVEGLI
jgi:hypothetical protein